MCAYAWKGDGAAEQVFASQRIFREVLTALSLPGRVVRVSAHRRFGSWGEAAGAVLFCLTDFETRVWTDAAAHDEQARNDLAFVNGTRFTDRAEACAFALVNDARSLPELTAFSQGTPAYPDRSATVVVEVRSLSRGTEMVLEGPGINAGINGSQRIRVDGLPEGFWAMWEKNGARFPQGVDMLLTCGDLMLGLPRTTRAREAACTSR